MKIVVHARVCKSESVCVCVCVRVRVRVFDLFSFM